MKKQTITATVVYPVEVSIEVETTTNVDEVWTAILAAADNAKLNQMISPTIMSCSMPGVVPSVIPIKEKSPDSQAEWVGNSLAAIKLAKESINNAIKGSPFIQRLRGGERMDINLKTIQKNLTTLHKELIKSISPPVEE